MRHVFSHILTASGEGKVEREKGLEPSTFCLGSVELMSVVARASKGE
jgi:hypothetical protein